MVECNCDRFEKVVGVATRLYIADFLECTGNDPARDLVYYRCRLCGAVWKQLNIGCGPKPILIKIRGEDTVQV